MADDRLTDDERVELLEKYDGIRVADVTDALEQLGFFEETLLDGSIRPLHRDVEEFSHRFVGFATTRRFHPTKRRRELPEPGEGFDDAYDEWRGDWGGEEEAPDIREGDVVVVEAHGLDAGIIGSMNGLAWIANGARGIVTNGAIRDTDEVVKQKIPAYSRRVGKTIIPGRVEMDAADVPVSVGRVRIEPGDLLVGDGDGVVAVPIEYADEVADRAADIQSSDQEVRRSLYDAVGLEEDFTLE